MKITGKTLKKLGYKPGKWFREALVYVNEHDLEGDALIAFLDGAQPKYIPVHDTAKPYHVNIDAEKAIEHDNVASVKATMDQLMLTPTLREGAIMPDACPTGSPGQIPVGGVVIAENAIHPAMHSADVCCSVMMTSYGKTDPKKVLDMAHSITHFGGGGRIDTFPLTDDIKERMRENVYLNTDKARKLARTHLGTQGDGNHFLYVGISEKTGETIMVTHHGSRGLGAYLYTQGMTRAEVFRRNISPDTMQKNAWIPYDTDEGKAYWDALQIVRAWTKLNHGVLHKTVAKKLKASVTDHFWNEHNFVFKRDNDFYHAKGATPLTMDFVPDAVDKRRLIPLNMSEPVLVVEGDATENNLGFAPHGAGRNVSRTAHIRSKGDRAVKDILAEETAGLDVRFYRGEPDISELPSAYKNADQVQAQMKKYGLGEVTDRIMPYGCIMAGNWKKNAPWKKKKRKRASIYND